MNKLIFLIGMIFFNNASFAFISGPSSISPGSHYLTLGRQMERGKIEPNENTASFQDAKIDISKVKYAYGLSQFLDLPSSSFYSELGYFTSAKEQVESNFFYDEDRGSYLTIGISGDLVHEPDRQFGLYFQVSPYRKYDKTKFSNPRLDKYAIGLTGAFNISDDLFQKNLIHYGSGDGSSQNSYVAIDTGFGYKMNQLLNRQLTLQTSLFVEADTSQRKDPSYDAAFSAPQTEDRIRAFKYGTSVGFDLGLSESLNLNFNFLQKLGGYDARSTQIYNLHLGIKF